MADIQAEIPSSNALANPAISDSPAAVPAANHNHSEQPPTSEPLAIVTNGNDDFQADDDGPSFNPAISDDIREDIEKIKGDAIGDTLYSSRFVLKTLIRLTTDDSNGKPLAEDEDFEKDLCTLWDMTIEKDVVQLLLEHDFLELVATIVEASEDQRLVEILVGVIGNMCAVAPVRESLGQSPTVLPALLQLIDCSDPLVLVQLMRLIHAALVFENSGDELIWLRHFQQTAGFVDQFAFILSNSMSSSLLVNAYEALNAFCTKFAVIEIQPDVVQRSANSFRDMIVRPQLIKGKIWLFCSHHLY